MDSIWSVTATGTSAKDILIFPQHIIHQDPRIIAGLSRYATTLGHTLATLQDGKELFSLSPDAFLISMQTVASIAGTLRTFYKVARCALATDGDGILSILPLHGLETVWKPATSELTEFHETFPGYLSSKNGPEMDKGRLEKICSTIQKAADVFPPFDTTFHGDNSDQNLFARIVRGELPQWRIWEDKDHVAFLTPFPNTPGLTVVVPRAHLSSDIFGLDATAYSELVQAAYKVAQSLKKAFDIRRCGMIFEGYEIDYAHVKLIPVHESSAVTIPRLQAEYQETYPGHVTTLEGPLVQDESSLAKDARALRGFFHPLS